MTSGAKGFGVLVAMLIASSNVCAGPWGLFRRNQNGGQPGTTQAAPVPVYAVADFRATCAGVAQRMAEIGRIRHFGNPGPWPYEGVGMAATREGAIRNCCYYGRRQLMESAAVQGANGYWFACNRYR